MGKTRIIAGQARGRKISVPEKGTRPTSDRAKEGLFSSIQARIGFDGVHVLDLFSGSGALGLEAASRGAQHVVLVESAAEAAQIIKKNIETVGISGVELIESKVSHYVPRAPRDYFDIILADPPYDLPDSEIQDMLRALIPTLHEGALVVVERHRESPETQWPEGFSPTQQKLKKRLYGIARMDMAYWEPRENTGKMEG